MERCTEMWQKKEDSFLPGGQDKEGPNEMEKSRKHQVLFPVEYAGARSDIRS